jgi:hypothetical protein
LALPLSRTILKNLHSQEMDHRQSDDRADSSPLALGRAAMSTKCLLTAAY